MCKDKTFTAIKLFIILLTQCSIGQFYGGEYNGGMEDFGFGDGGDAVNYGSTNSNYRIPTDTVAGRPPVTVPSAESHSITLIFFHGMGDQGDGWGDIFKSDLQPYLRNVKFVAPNAKEVGGMTQWFEYSGLDPSSPEDLEGLEAVKNYAHQLIDAEIGSGIPSSRIFLGGFSQGGPVALYAGLSYPEPLGGAICLSGFLLPRDTLPAPVRQLPWLNLANSGMPIFMGHGTNDPNVPYSVALQTANALRRFDPNVMLRAYPMGHSNCAAELRELIKFIQSAGN